jgi:outer membrane beta-barrel protein
MVGSKFVIKKLGRTALPFLVAVGLATSAMVMKPSVALASSDNVIEFPDEELAPESVLPVFDHPVSVMNRNVGLRKRFELGPEFGLSLMEPFYNPYNLGGSLSYYLNEESAINIVGTYFFPGLNSNGNALNPIPGQPNINANLQYAPAPKYFLLANYQFTAFYGKISITKEFVMNLSLYGFLGGGVFGIGDSTNPAIDFGLGQNFYLSKSFALKFDLRFMIYQGPNVVSRPLDQVSSVQPSSSFDQTIQYSALLSAAAVFLLPGM